MTTGRSNIVFIACVAILVLCTNSLFAQSVSASFGSVYSTSTQTTTFLTVPVQGTQAIRGQFYGGGSVNTSVGSVGAPSGFYLAGNGSALQLQLTFTSNGQNGKISGNFTAAYKCSGTCTQSTLNISVSLSGTNIVASAKASPKYYIMSVLYDPPGDKSNSAYSTSVSQGAQSSISNNFTTSTSLRFGGGFLGSQSAVQFTAGSSVGDSSSFTVTTQATGGSQLSSTKQAIDHTQDQVFLLVDPTFTIEQSGSTTGTYKIGPSLRATGSFGSSGPPPDILNVNIAGLKTPSSIPLAYLTPQVVVPGTTLPGLSFICANPLPPAQCTQANACGCTSSDFAPVVSQGDPLANVTSQTTAPTSVDAAGYGYLEAVALEGPQQAGGGTVSHTYSLSDSTVSGHSTSSGYSYSVGVTNGWQLSGPLSLGITVTNTFGFSQTQTFGTQNGTAHTASVTLGSDKVGCFEYVDVYEDATYHTFAYALPQAPPSQCQ